MRLLHLLWPHLPLRLARSRFSGPFPEGPVVLGGQPWTPGLVIDANRPARELGIRRGMPLGSAHRPAPEAVFLDPDPDADAAALEAALDRLGSYSPSVAGSLDAADPTFGLLESQIDGLERLWGPEPQLVERIAGAVGNVLPGRPKAGIAGTRFTASLAALSSADGLQAVAPGGEEAFLAPFPAAALTRDADVQGRLARFGLRRIGQVAALPRSALVARFGEEGARLHARSIGQETAPFRPRRAPERLVLALPVEPAIEDLEPLRFILRRLVGALADQLLGRGAATSRARLELGLDVTFAPAGTPTALSVEQRFPEPTFEAEAIERLLVARLERTPPQAPVVRLELELAEVAPAAGQQLTLFTPQSARAARLGWQVARLALRFGEDRVSWLELADPEAPLAEDRWRRRPIVTGGIGSAEAGPGRAVPSQPAALLR